MTDRRQRVIQLLILLAALAVAVMPVVAWARAGGGGGFGGGGGGSGGGGDGLGYLIYFLLRLCIYHPFIGIPLTIGLGYLFYLGSQGANEGYKSRVIRKEVRHQRDQARTAAILKLQQVDPDFNEEAFLKRVSDGFLAIQQAWSDQDMTPARAFISDGIFERFSLQIKMQQASGYRNVMENVRVIGSESIAIYANDQFDTIHVSIAAEAADYDVDLKSGRRRRGSNGSEPFTEIWSFHRRHGAKTLQRAGSIEGNCPSCGAPLEIQDRAECSSCGAVVNSGEYDWVLAEITQVSEWSVPDPDRKVPGLAAMHKSDPAFSVQHIEDRASVMFYRLNAATFFNDTGYAAPILATEVKGLPGMADLPDDQFWREPAVGKVEVLNVAPNEDMGTDEVRVLVRWSATKCKGDPAGRPSVVTPQAIYSHVYVLSRRQGVKSSKSRTFSSSSCPNCGGPIAVSRERTCSFCGTPLTDGKLDWVLEGIERYRHKWAYAAAADVEAAPAELPPLPLSDGRSAVSFDPSLMLAVLARVATSDGHVDEKERDALRKLAAHSGMTDADVQRVVETAAHTEIELPVPETPAAASQILQQVIHVCLADGRFTRPERRLVSNFATKLDYSNADVDMMIAKEKRAMFQEARRLRRERKANGRTTVG